MAKPLVFNAARKQQRVVAAQFIRHTHRVAVTSGLPILVISECHQHGSTFGERLADAFQQIFDRGFERVIAIGNDCPTLTAADLRVAAQKLDTANAVFGPAADGGAYLVGLRRDAFEPEAFAALDWQTDRTLADLEAYVAGGFSCLSEKSDVDSATGLQRQLRSHLFPIFLKTRLLHLLNLSSPRWVDHPVFAPKAALLSAVGLRGPPL